MALNNNRELHIKWVKQILLYTFLLFLFSYNVINFCTYMSSNSELVINYQRPEDQIKEFRNPLIATAFINSSNRLKLLILPYNLPNAKYVKNTKLLKLKNKKIKILQNELTDEKHIKYLQKYFNEVVMADTIKAENNTIFVWFDNLENPLVTFDKIINFVKEQHLQPKTYDLLDIKKISDIDFIKNEAMAHTLNDQLDNLKNFANDYRLELRKLLIQDETDIENNHQFNDKAASMVIACDENDNCEEFADFSFKKSLVMSIKQNLLSANKTYSEHKKRIFLLTQLKKQYFDTEKDFVNDLDSSLGVVMQKGLLTGIMAPCYWEKNTTPEEFVKKLKIKSGINPDYWSDDIKIYYFKAVEVFL